MISCFKVVPAPFSRLFLLIAFQNIRFTFRPYEHKASAALFHLIMSCKSPLLDLPWLPFRQFVDAVADLLGLQKLLIVGLVSGTKHTQGVYLYTDLIGAV